MGYDEENLYSSAYDEPSCWPFDRYTGTPPPMMRSIHGCQFDVTCLGPALVLLLCCHSDVDTSTLGLATSLENNTKHEPSKESIGDLIGMLDISQSDNPTEPSVGILYPPGSLFPDEPLGLGGNRYLSTCTVRTVVLRGSAIYEVHLP